MMKRNWMIIQIKLIKYKKRIIKNLSTIVNCILPKQTTWQHFFVQRLEILDFFLGGKWKSSLKKTGSYLMNKLMSIIKLSRVRISRDKQLLLISLNWQKKIIYPRFNTSSIAIIVNIGENYQNNYICLQSIWLHTKKTYKIFAITNNIKNSSVSNTENIVVIENPNNVTNLLEHYQLIRGGITSSEYVLFLDSNCIVTDKYFESMVSILSHEKKCVAVSGKIVDIYNETLLYAGSDISPNGIIRIRGFGQPADKPEYSYVSAIDMPAEECMLMRKNDLDKLCDEDTSGQNSITSILRKNDCKILFQPNAIIKHQDPEKFKNFDSYKISTDHTIKKFNKKDQIRSTKILVLDDLIPAIRYGSGFPRLYEMLSCLSELGYSVTFFPVGNPVKVQPETSKLQEKGIEVFWGQYANSKSFISERQNQYDIVLISRPQVFEKLYAPVKENFPNSAIIYDAEALFYTREQSKEKVISNIASKNTENLAKQEMRLLEQADMVISVSSIEKEAMLQQSSQKNIEVWGHIQDIKENRIPFNQRHGILFLGSFFAGQGSPNEDAALYFAKDVFPKILEKLDCKLYIVGANPTKAVKQLVSNKIEVTGYVENLEDYFYKCRVNVVPTRFAAGIPLKLLQVMSYGIPTVVSELIASQLVLSNHKEVLIAKNAMAFAEKTLLLYSNETLWTTISQNSFKFVLDNFSKSSMMKKLETIIEKSLTLREESQHINLATHNTPDKLFQL
ncbi:MAG: glycosyltransferase [Anaerolineae bacterium]|nr:glycosyltransferase [Anaerolineae bacterium]